MTLNIIMDFYNDICLLGHIKLTVFIQLSIQSIIQYQPRKI